VLCGLSLVAASALPAWSEPAQETSLEVRLGFDGVLKIGVPLPAEIRVPPLPSPGPAQLRVEAPALGPQAGVVTTSTVISFENVPGVARTFQFPLVVADIRRPLTVRAFMGEREILRRSIAIDPARVGGRVVVAVSTEPKSLAFLHSLPGRVIGAGIPEAMLPSVWQEYAGVDLLAVHDLDPARLDDAQRRALVMWVRMGGQLLVMARPRVPVPPFLIPLLPAQAGGPRIVSSVDALARRYGAGLPPGPVIVTSLAPRPDAVEIRTAGVPLIASAPEGWGRITVWAFDPWEPPFQGWDGIPRLWADALGSPPRPLVDTGAIAGRLPDRLPLDPRLHGAVGGVILVYVLLQYVLRRRSPSTAGAAAGFVLACLAVGVFGALAADVRDRSAVLVQATFVEQAGSAPIARAQCVAVAAIPYGGPYRLLAPRDAIAGPATPSGDLRLDMIAGGAVLSGQLRPGEGGRVFEAVGAVPLETSGTLSGDGGVLRVDLRSTSLRRAEVRWADRVYPLGDLPPGVSVRTLRPDLWTRLEDAPADDQRSAWIFRGPGGDVIMKPATPVLVGEMEGSASMFAFQGTGAPGRRLTILLVPLARR
jgi:hypothetical protein